MVRKEPTKKQKVLFMWETKARELLLNKKIVKVRYLTDEERDDLMWNNKPVMFMLDDETWIIPMADDEGNNGGALAIGETETLPVL